MQCKGCGRIFRSEGWLDPLKNYADDLNGNNGYLLTPYGIAFIFPDLFKEITKNWEDRYFKRYFDPLLDDIDDDDIDYIDDFETFEENFDKLEASHLRNPRLSYVYSIIDREVTLGEYRRIDYIVKSIIDFYYEDLKQVPSYNDLDKIMAFYKRVIPAGEYDSVRNDMQRHILNLRK